MKKLIIKIKNFFFPGSSKYWENRYKNNGNSGVGSYGDSAIYKATILNYFVEKWAIQSVMELGCGDGNQLKYFNFPIYIGLDVSKTTIHNCMELYKEDKTKTFYHFDGNNLPKEISSIQSALTLSLDVVYHLVEDSVFENYMSLLFNSSGKFVIIYAWDFNGKRQYHMRHRKFTEWVEQNRKDFKLLEMIRSEKGYCDFAVYEKIYN